MLTTVPELSSHVTECGCSTQVPVLTWSVVTAERVEQAAIILDVGVYGVREPVRINTVRVWLVKLLVTGVVE